MNGERKIRLSTKVTNQINKKSDRYTLSYKSYKALRLEVLRKCYKDPETDIDFVVDHNAVQKIHNSTDQDWSFKNLEFDNSEEDLSSLETTHNQYDKTASNSKSCKHKSKKTSEIVSESIGEISKQQEENGNNDDQDSSDQENEIQSLNDSKGDSSSSETARKKSSKALSERKSFKKTPEPKNLSKRVSRKKEVSKERVENENSDDQDYSSAQENVDQSVDDKEEDSISEADDAGPSFMRDIEDKSIGRNIEFERNWETTNNILVSDSSQKNVTSRRRSQRTKVCKKLDSKNLQSRKDYDSIANSKQKMEQKNLIVNYFKPKTTVITQEITTDTNNQSTVKNIARDSEERADTSRVEDTFEGQEKSLSGKNEHSDIQEEEICADSEIGENLELTEDRDEEDSRDQIMSPEIEVCPKLVIDEERLEKETEEVESMGNNDGVNSQSGKSPEKQKVCSDVELQGNAGETDSQVSEKMLTEDYVSSSQDKQKTLKERRNNWYSKFEEYAKSASNKAREHSEAESFLDEVKEHGNLMTAENLDSSQDQDGENAVNEKVLKEQNVDSVRNEDKNPSQKTKVPENANKPKTLREQKVSLSQANEDNEDSEDENFSQKTKASEKLIKCKTLRKQQTYSDSEPEEKANSVRNQDENSSQKTRVPKNANKQKILKKQKLSLSQANEDNENSEDDNYWEETKVSEKLVKHKTLRKQQIYSDSETEEKADYARNQDKNSSQKPKVPKNSSKQKTLKEQKVDSDSESEENFELTADKDDKDSEDENSLEETKASENLVTREYVASSQDQDAQNIATLKAKERKLSLNSKPEEKVELEGNEDEDSSQEMKVAENTNNRKTLKDKKDHPDSKSEEKEAAGVDNSSEKSLEDGAEELDISDMPLMTEDEKKNSIYYTESQIDNLDTQFDENKKDEDSEQSELADETQADSLDRSFTCSNIKTQVQKTGHSDKKDNKDNSNDFSYVLNSQPTGKQVPQTTADEKIPIPDTQSTQKNNWPEMEAGSEDEDNVVPETQGIQEESDSPDEIPNTAENEISPPEKGPKILKYEVVNQLYKIQKNEERPVPSDEQSLDEGFGKSESPSSSCTREKKHDLEDLEDLSRDREEEETMENKGYITSRCDYGGESENGENNEEKEAKKSKKKKKSRKESESENDNKKSKKKKKKDKLDEIPSTSREEKSKKKKKKKRDDFEAKERKVSSDEELVQPKKKMKIKIDRFESEEEEEIQNEESKKSKKKKDRESVDLLWVSKENEESIQLTLDETGRNDEDSSRNSSPHKKKSKKAKKVENIEIKEEDGEDQVDNDNLALEEQEQNVHEEDDLLPAESLKPMKRLDLFSQNLDSEDSDFPVVSQPKPKEKKSKKKRKNSVIEEEEPAKIEKMDLNESSDEKKKVHKSKKHKSSEETEVETHEKKSKEQKKSKKDTIKTCNIPDSELEDKPAEETEEVVSEEKKSKKQKKSKKDPIETYNVLDSELEDEKFRKKKKKTLEENLETEIPHEDQSRPEKPQGFFSQHDSGSENEDGKEELKAPESTEPEKKKKSKKRKHQDEEPTAENRRTSILSGSMGKVEKSPKKSEKSKEKDSKQKLDVSVGFNSEEDGQTPLAHSTCIVVNSKPEDEKAKTQSKPKMKKLHISTSDVVDLELMKPAMSEEKKASPEKKKKKMSKILDLVERDKLIEDERKCSFFMQNIEPAEDEVYVLQMPQKIVNKDLVGKKITIDGKKRIIQVDKIQYKTSNQLASTEFPCASKLSTRHKKFAMTIIKPVANIVFKEKLLTADTQKTPTSTELKPPKQKSTKNPDNKIKKQKVENIPYPEESEDDFIQTKIVTMKKTHKIASKLKPEDFTKKEKAKSPKVKTVHVH